MILVAAPGNDTRRLIIGANSRTGTALTGKGYGNRKVEL